MKSHSIERVWHLMPLLGFGPQFSDAVENGVADALGNPTPFPWSACVKRTTVRCWHGRRYPSVGETLHLWTGLMHPGARKLGEVPCARVREICVERPNPSPGTWVRTPERSRAPGRVILAGAELDALEVNTLAQGDGFLTANDFFNYVVPYAGTRYSGRLIEW